MRLPFILSILLLPLSAPAWAFERITDEAAFAATVDGRALTRFGISLDVSRNGEITGRGMGYPVTGRWEWQDGYFCRTLDWGGSDLGHNCQVVLQDGDRVRFHADRGNGDYADFRLR